MAADVAHRARSQSGETLIESLISIAVLSVVAVAAYTGFATSIGVSAEQKVNATAATILRSAAEQLQSPDRPFVPRAGCPGAGTYTLPAAVGTPPGFAVSVESVSWWTGASATPTDSDRIEFNPACPGVDPGLQQIVLRLTEPSGDTASLTVLKRSTP